MSEATLIGEVQKQFKEENGATELPDHKRSHRARNGKQTFDSGCTACRMVENGNVLKQKYGLMLPQAYEGWVRKLNGKRIRVNETRVIAMEKDRMAKEFLTALMRDKHVV